jgi:trehalose 6-phosphate phosphatase
LKEFAWSNVLLAFDYDGTLSPLVSNRHEARMRLETRALLRQSSRAYPVIVISGRAQADVLARVRGLGVQAAIGNHGLEPWHASDGYLSEVRRWIPILSRTFERSGGIDIEDKAYSLAIHYRRSRQKRAARALIVETALGLRGVRVILGKQVVNVLPRGAPHKGMALERERSRLGCDTAIYVGDDETDEDVFALDQPGRLLSIRVGVKASSSAPYHIANQRAIDELLRVLVEQRSQAAPARRAAR